jgi:AGCS family alanine or glycine:cation symporter
VTIIPSVVHLVIQDAFNFKAIFSGMAGSCMIYGIKRGLYSNEAGVGSAPNASASADVTHPVKQGLVQMLSVYIDTLLLCSATAIMCLSSGILPSVKLSGAPYVQQALSTVFGSFGPIFITIAMILFAFTTLIGNLYYVDNAVAYLNHKKKPGKGAMTIIHIICVLVIFVGAVVPMDAAWALADISMGLMTLINLPACFLLSSIVIHALRDYEEKRKTVEHPAFKGEDIGLYDLDCWQ